MSSKAARELADWIVEHGPFYPDGVLLDGDAAELALRIDAAVKPLVDSCEALLIAYRRNVPEHAGRAILEGVKPWRDEA